MSDAGRSPASIISAPTGGGAVSGIGEKFAPDLHTGTGNFTIPIEVPPGRNGFQPSLNLVYSTGKGNGVWGLGWSLDVPGVRRRTSKGVPQYGGRDVFVLSGAEDLVQVTGNYPGRVGYRPRTEGLFARIEHVADGVQDYWEVRSKDGLTSWYGTPHPTPVPAGWTDPATIRKPGPGAQHVFAWKLTKTQDPFGNLIQYHYDDRDAGLAVEQNGPHHWDQPLLTHIDYADHGPPGDIRFLLRVRFEYEPRMDAFSEYRAGFEIRTTRRCKRILIESRTNDGVRSVRHYDLKYVKNHPANGISLLSQIAVSGYGDGNQDVQELPALKFAYSGFDPAKRRFASVAGADLPSSSLANPDMELVDLFGSGLPDLLQMNGTVRYWRNLGQGRFAAPRHMSQAPSGVVLADPGVQLLDADGDGRADLLVTKPALAGYYPLSFGGSWDPGGIRRYTHAPSFNLKDPNVRLVDLDGDGVTDAIRSGSSLECFFNHPTKGWYATRRIPRSALEDFPNINFSDSRVKWADMTGDGLQDIVLVHDRKVDYWPNLGHGRWGKRVSMENSPDLPYGYDPKHVLLGDVDGDGLADLVYVQNGQVRLWVNHSGNRWSDEPTTILGTPPITSIDAFRLVDLYGTGVAGLLWSADTSGAAPNNLRFLDLTGGVKPYLLEMVDNQMGAVTKVQYAPSTRYFAEDHKDPRTRWRTPLPFPVQVVARVEVVDQISGGKLTTEYRYRHGYWDGVEREFHGFGMVEQRDTETFEEYHRPGLHPQQPYTAVAADHFSPPILTKTWFHQGAVGDAYGDFDENDYRAEYWSGDGQLIDNEGGINTFLAPFPRTVTGRRVKRDALRTLRGSVLRTELYALDGSERQSRPYTVTEHAYDIAKVVQQDGTISLHHQPQPSDLTTAVDDDRPQHVFFAHPRAMRTTEWERGDDPMTSFTFIDSASYDEFGQPGRQTQIACPRGWRTMDETTTACLGTRSRTLYARPSNLHQTYIVDREAKNTIFEIRPTTARTVTELAMLADDGAELSVISQTVHYYDGEPFTGLANGTVGKFGALMRTESLVMTDEILQTAYGPQRPPYLTSNDTAAWTTDYPQTFRQSLSSRAGYSHHAGDGIHAAGYYVTTERRRYDFQTLDQPPRGLMVTLRPALGTSDGKLDVQTTYDDPYHLLPTEVTDPLGLSIRSKYDYRHLKPREITDANVTRSTFTFTPIGLLATSSIIGKAPGEGDQQHPSVTLRYDLRAFEKHEQPIYVHTTLRENHDGADIIETREYSDGFGRLLQTRAEAEDVLFGDTPFGANVIPAAQSAAPGQILGRSRADGAPVNVVVSGWQTYDNRGQVVERFEPFFDSGWTYARPKDHQHGTKATMFYDPRGRLARTLNENKSEQRVVFGIPVTLDNPETFRPTPWVAYTYDANDNAGRTHSTSSQSFAHHYNTPSHVVVDALGRTVEAVERNRTPNGSTEEYVTQMTYDILGNVLTVTDPLGRQKAFVYVYDLVSRRLRMDNIDTGVRLTVFDASGLLIEQRDSKGALTLHAYDIADRPVRTWARNHQTGQVTLRERLDYGDGSRPDQDAAEREANRNANRLGRPHRHYDEAGLLVVEAYDFKGNVLARRRHVIKDTVLVGGWTAAWDHTNAEDALDTTAYVSDFTYDALNRTTLLRCPQDVTGGRKELRPAYNQAGALQSLTINGYPYVRQIAYNAKGQRTLVVYGNNVLTAYAYDPQTFLLQRLWTGSYTLPAGTQFTYQPASPTQPLQDFRYERDLVGNVIKVHDRAPGCGLLATPNQFDREFTYDALYRLFTATGRECNTPPPQRPWENSLRCHDITSTRAYTQTYQYDRVGNITQIRHAAANTTPTRHFTLVPGTNRLQQVTVGADHFTYRYDSNGNLAQETTSRHFTWDHCDRMTGYRTQPADAVPSLTAFYLYDGTGQRVKKLVRDQGGMIKTTIYIDGVFEHHTHGAVENNTLHVTDDQRRIALVRIGSPLPGDGASDKPIQYHLGDHLGSSHIVLDDAGSSISFEEYTPYGDTAFGGHSRKRYRHRGKERDEESGLNYYGHRYYAPWLARWVSPDPAGPVDGPNLYQYVRANPVTIIDPSGLNSLHPEDTDIHGIWREGQPSDSQSNIQATMSGQPPSGEPPPSSQPPSGEPPPSSQPQSQEEADDDPSRRGERFRRGQGQQRQESIEEARERLKRNRPRVKGEDPEWEGVKRPKQSGIHSGKKTEQNADFERRPGARRRKEALPQTATPHNQPKPVRPQRPTPLKPPKPEASKPDPAPLPPSTPAEPAPVPQQPLLPHPAEPRTPSGLTPDQLRRLQEADKPLEQDAYDWAAMLTLGFIGSRIALGVIGRSVVSGAGRSAAPVGGGRLIPALR